MDIDKNHYQLLGLPPVSPDHEIRQALDRKEREARALAHTSPAQSRQLWEQIRQVRHDLLTDPKRRGEYDTAVLVAVPAPDRPTSAPLITAPSVPRAQPAPAPASRPRVSPRVSRERVTPRDEKRRRTVLA